MTAEKRYSMIKARHVAGPENDLGMNEELNVPDTLTKQEADFCELYVFGCDPYAGDAKRCYEDVFKESGGLTLKKARELMEREDVKLYIARLRKMANYETAELKSRLTEKLMHIIDETSTAVYTDRFCTPLSPAPLRAVAVQAIKTLMDMHPLKVAQEAKLELTGEGGAAGITFNLIAPPTQAEPEV